MGAVGHSPQEAAEQTSGRQRERPGASGQGSNPRGGTRSPQNHRGVTRSRSTRGKNLNFAIRASGRTRRIPRQSHTVSSFAGRGESLPIGVAGGAWDELCSPLFQK